MFFRALGVLAGLALAACASDEPGSPAEHLDASSNDVVDGSTTVDADVSVDAADAESAACDPTVDPSRLGIASAPLNATGSLPLDEGPQLLGEGLPLTLAPQQGWEAGLRWKGDRMFMLADLGFWDIAAEGPAQWNPAGSLIVASVRAGDVDADGDFDLLVLMTAVNDMPGSSDPPNPFVTRLVLWERTASGLTERAEIVRAQGLVLAMAHAFADMDGDGDLDIVGFEGGLPVGYVHDGALEFERVELAEPAPELDDTGALALDYADRNQDGAGDLLIIVGSFAGNQLENEALVLLGDGQGGLEAPGPAAKGEAPLVPHGPDGVGLAIADVTGDGLADVLAQDDQSEGGEPYMRLYVSTSATDLAPALEIDGLGFELADIDEDGATDIVTTRDDRLVALLSRGDGAFEPLELGVSMAAPNVIDYVVDPGQGDGPAVLHVLYKLRACPTCDARCEGRCLFDTCLECLSNADCESGSGCSANACAP